MGRKKEYVLLAVLCTVFLIAVAYLFQIWEEYHEADSGYRELQKYVMEKPEAGKEHKGQDENPERGRDNLPEIDFEGLRAVNGDIVAWIRIPGIEVDYPVVQGKDDEPYLHYTFDGKANKAGSMQEERQELLEEIVLSTCSSFSDMRLILRMSIVDIS